MQPTVTPLQAESDALAYYVFCGEKGFDSVGKNVRRFVHKYETDPWATPATTLVIRSVEDATTFVGGLRLVHRILCINPKR